MYRPYDVREAFRIKEMYSTYDFKRENDYYFDGEEHNFWELVIVVDGKIGVTANGDVFILKKGQAILHEPMEYHRLWSEENTFPRIIIFSFSAYNMPSFSSRLFEVENEEEIIELASKMIDALNTGFLHIKDIDKDKRIEFSMALKEFEIFLLKTFRNKITNDIADKSKGAENYAMIINTMEENIHKSLSVGDIARLCNMSEINLKKTFSKYSGVGVMNYFNRMKMNMAVSLIEGGMRITEAAERVGFYNQNYFSTVFKRVIGKAPSHYKPSKNTIKPN